MSFHLTIIAHGHGIAAFTRHLPLWQAMQPQGGLVLAPETDPIPQARSPWPVALVGKASHSGPEALKRLRWLLSHLHQEQSIFTSHLIFEYDSFSLSPQWTPQPGFTGNPFQNDHLWRFISPRYLNPPWCLDHQSLGAMRAVSDKYPNVSEEGFADRYLSALAHLSNVPMLPHIPVGFSAGSIDETNLDRLRSAIHSGSAMIHGCKTAWALAACQQFYDERPKTP